MRFQNGHLYIGSQSTVDLATRFGTPLYVYDAASIERQIANVKRAFRGLPLKPFYAMKANGNLEILRLVRSHGFGCDAVSPGEVYLARHAGYTPEEIWFTCSNVSDEDLRAVGDGRIVVNVNSMSEIDRCLALGIPNPIALRVNPDVGAGHHRDTITGGSGVKFGIDVAELESARMLVEDSGRKVVGLHAHIGSGVSDVAPLLEAARRLVELSSAFPNLQWINFGGGMGIPYRPGDHEFPIDDYGRELTAIAGAALRARSLRAILEPGRYIVGPSGILLARVTTKRVSAGVDWVGCDTGFNHLARPSKYGAYHHLVNASSGSDASLRESFRRESMSEEVVVAGNICESGDVFTRDENGRTLTRPVDRTQVGDLLAFCDAGAYGFSMASHYNARLLPAEVLVTGNGVRVIRKAQTYEDLIRGQE